MELLSGSGESRLLKFVKIHPPKNKGLEVYKHLMGDYKLGVVSDGKSGSATEFGNSPTSSLLFTSSSIPNVPPPSVVSTISNPLSNGNATVIKDDLLMDKSISKTPLQVSPSGEKIGEQLFKQPLSDAVDEDNKLDSRNFNVPNPVTNGNTISVGQQLTNGLQDKAKLSPNNHLTVSIHDQMNSTSLSSAFSDTSGLSNMSASSSGGMSLNSLWSTNPPLDDTQQGIAGNVNVTPLSFQNFPSNISSSQIYSSASVVNQQIPNLSPTQTPQNRRAITATHNFPHGQMKLPQQSQPQLLANKAVYSGWSTVPPQQQNTWSSASQSPVNVSPSAWNTIHRGRSVPNLGPLSPTGLHKNLSFPPTTQQNCLVSNQLNALNKYRRSTSYPGKGPFPQGSYELSSQNDTSRDSMLMYQVRFCV